MTPDAAVAALGDVVERAAADAERLAALLDEEAELLRARRLEAWEALAPRKDALVRTLDGAGAELATALAAAAGDDVPPAARIERVRARGHGALAESIEALRAVVERCRRRNLANGRFVERLHRHTRRALELLSGTDAPGAGLYGRDGAARAAVPRHYAGTA